MGPNGRISLFVKQADAAFWLCTVESKFIFSYFILVVTTTSIGKLYSKAIIFAHFTCIAHMYTTHNFKMLYVYIDDIMGGLHASDLVVLMEVSQTTL